MTGSRRFRYWSPLFWLPVGCSEYVVREEPAPPVADAPGGGEDDDFGDPPDWADCGGGLWGSYYNLTADHPDVEPEIDAPPPTGYTNLDWWDDSHLAFERFDGGVDMGAEWWPVDQGFEADPAYFAVRWSAWLRVSDDDAGDCGGVEATLGSSDDVWVVVNGQVVAELPGVRDFDPQTICLDVTTGQWPFELWYAHRSGSSGFRFRLLGDNGQICPGETGG